LHDVQEPVPDTIAQDNDISVLSTSAIDNDIVPNADQIVAKEFIDDKPCQASYELDNNLKEENDNQSITTAETNPSITTTPNTKKERFKLSSPFKKSPKPTQTQYETPSINDIICSGTISTRLSLKKIITKKWHEDNYYIQYQNNSKSMIILFRNHDDFHNWLYNPYLEDKARKCLIRFTIDFHGEMQHKNVRGFKLTDIKAKCYKRNDAVMYNFKLEKWSDMGQSLYGAFGSTEKYEIEKFYGILKECLLACPNRGLRSISDLLVS